MTYNRAVYGNKGELMADPNETTVSLMMDRTAEVGATIENILQQKGEIVNVLTHDVVERKLLLKELMMSAYIGGFFTGIHQQESKDSDHH